MADNIRWGLDNPHPFSQMKTELIWEGKYDEYGNRRAVDVAGECHAAPEDRNGGPAAERGRRVRSD